MGLSKTQWVPILLVLVLIVSLMVFAGGPDEKTVKVPRPEPGFHWAYESEFGENAITHLGPGRILDHHGQPVDVEVVLMETWNSPVIGADGPWKVTDQFFTTSDFRSIVSIRSICVPETNPYCNPNMEPMIWFPHNTPWLGGVSELWGAEFAFDRSGFGFENSTVHPAGDWKISRNEGFISAIPLAQPVYPRLVPETSQFGRLGLQIEEGDFLPRKLPMELGDWTLSHHGTLPVQEQMRSVGAPDRLLEMPKPDNRSDPLPYERDPSYARFSFTEMYEVLKSEGVVTENTLLAGAGTTRSERLYVDHPHPLPLLPQWTNLSEWREWTVFTTEEGEQQALEYKITKESLISGEVSYDVQRVRDVGRSELLVEENRFSGQMVALDDMVYHAASLFPEYPRGDYLFIIHKPYHNMPAQYAFEIGTILYADQSAEEEHQFPVVLRYDASTGGLLFVEAVPDKLERTFIIGLPSGE